MKKHAVVLGCGMVGSVMARELAGDDNYEVTALDASEHNLQRLATTARLTPRRADLSRNEDLQSAISHADVVLGALPSRMGWAALDAVVRSGKPYCDISFMPEETLALDPLARQHNAIAVVDCGVSPGLSNMMVAFAAAQLDQAERAEIMVGGLPRARHWPFQYKAPFAPWDVIEEYTRPARMRENATLVIRPALSEPQLVEFPGIGTLEAFNTDGLRSLLATLDIPNMKEKTLRYPGHIELMRAFRETGYFSQSPIDVQGVSVRPIDVTAALLFPKWKPGESEEEFTLLRVIVEGLHAGKRTRHQFDLFDQYDPVRNMSSMSRTTAFPCVIVARMLAEGRISGAGVFAPEMLASRPGFFEHVVSELRHRGVRVTHNVTSVQDETR